MRWRYLFVESPKSACSTIKVTLQRAELEDQDYCPRSDDVHDRELSPLLRPIQIASLPKLIHAPDIFKFCFVRQPETRVLACYLNKIASRKADPKERVQILAELCRSDESADAFISFYDFLRAVSMQPVGKMDLHWRPQHALLTPDILPYDFVGRFETLCKDLGFVCQRLGMPFKKYYCEQREHRTEANTRIQEFYGPDEVELVEKIYAEDFRVFGYEPAARQLVA